MGRETSSQLVVSELQTSLPAWQHAETSHPPCQRPVISSIGSPEIAFWRLLPFLPAGRYDEGMA
jgi:hypothetical protein